MGRATPKKKPSVGSSNTLLDFFNKSSTTAGKGATPSRPKGKDKGNLPTTNGSARDPVIIVDSDEEDIAPIDVKPTMVSPPLPEPLIVDVPMAGPSRLPRSISPIPVNEPPHNPFPNLPDFKPPSTWPTIVSTADQEEENLEYDDNRDGSVIDVDSDDDLDETIDDEIEISNPHPVLSSHPLTVPAPAGGLDEFDPGLEWDEPDEGMGMEEEGDEEASDIIATPPPVVKRRKLNGSTGKMEECPVCGKSLRGQPNENVGVPPRGLLMDRLRCNI